MECASERFRHAVLDALEAQVSVLATLGNARLPFFLALRARPDVEVLTLTEHNRDAMVAELCARLHRLGGRLT
jgi:nucleoside-triphosphatase THEP1